MATENTRKAQKMCLVSVVIPTYNSAPFLSESIDSVLRQTYPSVEVICIDDGSSDNSWKIIERYRGKVRGFKVEHQGACHARNYGAHEAYGKFLMFLDADDLIAPDTLNHLVSALFEVEDHIAVTPWCYLVNNQSNDCTLASPGLTLCPPHGDYVLDWLRGWYIPTCAILWPREVFVRTGGWDEELTANQDGDLMLRALLKGVGVVKANGGRGYYRRCVGKSSVSNDLSDVALRSRMRVWTKVLKTLEGRRNLDKYNVAIAQGCHGLARAVFEEAANPLIGRECVNLGRKLAGRRAVTGTLLHCLLCYVIGLEYKVWITNKLARLGLMRSTRRKTALQGVNLRP